MKSTKVHKWRSIRLLILAMYLRAGDEVLGALRSEFTGARGWLYARKEALSEREIDQGWTQILNEMEAERLRTLDEMLKFKQIAAQVVDDLPRGPRIVAVLSNIVRLLEDFCPQTLSWKYIADHKLGIERTLASASNRLRVMADDVDTVYVVPKSRHSQEQIETMVAKWIEINGPASSRHIARELGVSHQAVTKTNAYKTYKPLPRPIHQPYDDQAFSIINGTDPGEELAADELRVKIRKIAPPDMLSALETVMNSSNSDELETILDHLRDEADDNRDLWEKRRLRV